MTNHIRLQAFVPYYIAKWIREEAESHNESVSICVRDILVAAHYSHENDQGEVLTAAERIREAVFASVALDAILSAHPDSSLRQKAHDAYARRLERLGLGSASLGGGK